MDKTINILCIGDESVGKTSMINKCNSKMDSPIKPTIGVDSVPHDLGDKPYKSCIFDASGATKFKFEVKTYVKKTDIFVIFYDITSRQSFQDLDKWIGFISEDSIKSLFIIGNKKDLEDNRSISFEKGNQYAKQHNATFLETSINENIDYFDKIIEIALPILKDKEEQKEKSPESEISPDSTLQDSLNILVNLMNEMKQIMGELDNSEEIKNITDKVLKSIEKLNNSPDQPKIALLELVDSVIYMLQSFEDIGNLVKENSSLSNEKQQELNNYMNSITALKETFTTLK